MTSITIDLKVGQTLRIGEASVRLERKSGQLARLVISADKSVPIKPPKQCGQPAVLNAPMPLAGDTHG